MFAAAAPGLEPIVAQELRHLEAKSVTVVEGGVNFRGDLSSLYIANLSLRVASRVIVRIAEFHADSFHELERRVKRIQWREYLNDNSAVRFRVTTRKSRLYHSDAIAQRFADGISRELPGVKFSVSRDDEESTEAAQLFVVRFVRDECVVSIDSSGDLLHRRGYRLATGKAPLRETLAAAMVLSSGWDGRSALIDPMCGSGTIAIEAAMLAAGLQPGANRSFAFENWPSYDRSLWIELKQRKNRPISTIGAILASDRDDGAVKSAYENAERAGVADRISFATQPISAIAPPPAPGAVITNPPYGKRVGENRSLRNLYAQLGNILKKKASGYSLSVLSADRTLERALGLPLEEVLQTSNGGIRVRLLQGTVRAVPLLNTLP